MIKIRDLNLLYFKMACKYRPRLILAINRTRKLINIDPFSSSSQNLLSSKLSVQQNLYLTLFCKAFLTIAVIFDMKDTMLSNAWEVFFDCFHFCSFDHRIQNSLQVFTLNVKYFPPERMCQGVTHDSLHYLLSLANII